MNTSVKLLFVFLLLCVATRVFYVNSQEDTPFLVDRYTTLSETSALAEHFIELSVTIGNPMNESTYVNVTILASGIACFPTNSSLIMLPPSLSNGSASTKATSFLLASNSSGSFPMEVQLWWNNTKVDSKLFVLNVYAALDPSMWGLWIRVNILVWGLATLIIAVQFFNPLWKLRTINERTKQAVEHSKILPFLLIAGLLLVVAWYFSASYDNYYAFLPFLVGNQRELESLLAAGWILGVISFGFLLFRRYQWSTSLSRLLLIILLLLFVLDWFTVPSPPFFGLETLGIIVFSVILNVLAEIGIKGLFEEIRKRTRKTQ